MTIDADTEDTFLEIDAAFRLTYLDDSPAANHAYAEGISL